MIVILAMPFNFISSNSHVYHRNTQCLVCNATYYDFSYVFHIMCLSDVCKTMYVYFKKANKYVICNCMYTVLNIYLYFTCSHSKHIL